MKLAGFLFMVSTVASQSALNLTVSEGVGGAVNLEVLGSGSAGNGSSYIMAFGTTTDSFLSDGESGRSQPTSAPTIAIGVSPVRNYLYRDAGGINLNLHSMIELDFSSIFPPQAADLSSLDGTYLLDQWRFSDFKPGAYVLSEANTSIVFLQSALFSGLGEITLTVVPEPSTTLMGLFSVIGLLRRLR